MSERGALARDAAAAMARHVATLVAGFVTIPILARMLGASRLGYWNLLGTAAFLLGLCDLGLNTATLRAAAGTDPAYAKQVARVASLMTLVLSVPAAALCVVWLWSAAEQLPQEQQSDARRAVLIGLSGGVIAAVTQSLRSYAQGQGRIVALAWGRAAGVLVQLALTIGLLLLGHELTAVAVGFAAGAALESALGYRAARDDVHAPGLPTGDQRKEMVRVAGSAMLTNVSVILAVRADVLVLERVTNLATIGAYSVAARLVDQGFTLVKQVSAALVPRLGKRASDRSGSVLLGTMIIGIMAVGPLAATAVAGRPILVLWAGEPIDLPILGVALAWLAGAAMMASMSEVAGAAISLGDNPLTGARFVAIGSALNVVLSVAGGYAFGAWAVAASTLAGNAIIALLVWRRSYRSFHWSPSVVLRVWLPIAGSGVVGAVTAALCQSASLHAILAVGVGAVLSVALGAGVLYLLRTPEVP